MNKLIFSIILSLLYISNHAVFASSDLTQYCESLINRVKTENRTTESLSPENPVSLPIGISKKLGGIEYLLIIDSMSISPGSGNFLRAFMGIEIPGKDKKVYFMADNVRFTKGGIASGAKLTLLEDVSVDFGSKATLTFKAGEGKTSVNLGCDGYESMVVSCEVEFSRDLIIPEDDNGNVLPGTIKTAFESQMASFGELLAKVSVPNFQIAVLPGFSFKVSDATIDMSQVSNALDFPTTYQSNDMDRGGSPLFEGLYIRELQVKFPKNLKSTDNVRPTMTTYQLIVDDYGVSGIFSGSKLLSLEKGTIGKWAFSIDSAYFNLKSNTIQQAKFNGKIVAPVISDKTPLAYSAMIQTGGEYFFQVSNFNNLSMDMWAATLKLDPNSSIELTVANNEFYPKATLNGSISVEAKGSKVSLADLKFQEMVIQRKAPILAVKSFELSSEKATQTMSKFPVSLKKLGLALPTGLQAGLDIDLRLNLVPNGAGGFAAEGDLRILAKIDTMLAKPRFNFDGVNINDFSLDVNSGPYKMKGSIKIYRDDAVYGDGLRGAIALELVEKFKVSATAQFGMVRDFRYFYADALMVVPGGVPIFTGVALYGFGGGVYYKMKQNSPAPTFSSTSTTVPSSDEIGKSASGITYVPDEETFLGVKATVVIGTHPTPDAFNGDATLDIAFNRNGGVNKVSISGNAYFMKPPVVASQGSGTSSAVSASLFFAYDFTNTTLYGNIKAYVNMPGVLQGTGANNLAGEAVIYFSPDKWYIYVGHPEKGRRIGLKVVSLFNINSYFCMGTEIPGIPPPDFDVSGILGNSAYSANTLDGRNSRGFIFGASANFSTGDLTFLSFYASFNAGLGFDVMLSQYSLDTRCEGSDKPIGINGWYAQGQAYGYFQGKIGIKVNMRAYKGNFEILQINAAALVQGKFPNPTWFKGNVGGNYSILDGLVKGNCQFEVELGEQCKIKVNNPVAGIQVISECSPSENAQDVDVFTAPQAAFNLTIGKSFEIIDINGVKRSIKIELDKFQILDGTNVLTGTQEWNTDNNVIAMTPTDMLPQKKKLKLSVKIVFYEYKNSKWEKIMDNNKEVSESKEYEFETGEAPKYIPHSQIQYAYPSLKQYNFYKDEVSSGYIELKQGGWDYLFTPDKDFKQVLRFSTTGENHESQSINYNNSTKRVTFTFPSTLRNEKVYAYQIVNVPTAEKMSVDKNVSNVTTTAQESGETKVDVQTKDIEGSIQILEEKSIFDSYVRTSKYNTFKAKIEGLTLRNSYEVPLTIVQGIDEIGNNYTGSELFSEEEISPTAPSASMIRFEADVNNSWFTTYNNPRVYDNYPNHGLIIQNRTVDVFGTRPVRAINMLQSGKNELNDDGSVKSQTYPADFANLIYNLDFWVGRDYFELRDKAAAYAIAKGSSTWTNQIINTFYVGLYRDSYKVKMLYYLPGSTTANSSVDVQINTK